MLVFLALLSLASASTLQIHRLDSNQLPLNIVQLLRSPGQTIHGLRGSTVQYLGQPQLALEPNRQHSLVSLQPTLQQQTIQTILPDNQPLILTSSQPNIHQQLAFEAVQPNRQQVAVVSLQPNNQQLATIETIDPNNQRVATVETIQQINPQRQIVIQPVVPQNQQQTITLLETNPLRNPIQTLQIESAAQPLQYSNIVQPIQTVHPRHAFRVENGRGAQHISYFLRGSDLENQAVLNQPQVSALNQIVQPAQYSSVSVVEPQISTLLVQPQRQLGVQQIVGQQDSQLK